MNLERRKLFALAGLAAIAGGSAQAGPELDDTGAGIVCRISKQYGEWCVLVPDFDQMGWKPGVTRPLINWMPIHKYLAALDATMETM